MAYTPKKIGDLCVEDRTIISAASPAAHLPFLGLEHIESVTGRIRRDALSCANHSDGTAFLFDTRHVLYCKLRPYLNKVAVPDFAGRCTTELIPLLPQEGISREFLAWILRRPQTVRAAMQERTGARMPRANLRHVLAQEVLVPDSIQEQRRITEAMTRQIDLVIAVRSAYREQLRLLEVYEQRALSEFPLPLELVDGALETSTCRSV
jgi:type I restriction enzyme, S subunit